MAATLDRLGPATRALARSTAVLGEQVELDPRAELARIPRAEAAPIAGELARTRILKDTMPLRFRHPILAGAPRADFVTASERRIAELATGGVSNAEIAQGLFLTVKTVEMHLTRAYRKLGIGRRSGSPTRSPAICRAPVQGRPRRAAGRERGPSAHAQDRPGATKSPTVPPTQSASLAGSVDF